MNTKTMTIGLMCLLAVVASMPTVTAHNPDPDDDCAYESSLDLVNGGYDRPAIKNLDMGYHCAKHETVDCVVGEGLECYF